jgi:hypothetical protein
MGDLFAVVCRQPSGHETVLVGLLFDTKTAAKRASAKRNRLANAIAMGFVHRVERVVKNPKATSRSNLYLIADGANRG